MKAEELARRLQELCEEALPMPGAGRTAMRHRRLMEIGREDLTLAKMIEAHWDAHAILVEASRVPEPGALYGVWTSEIPGQALRLEPVEGGYRLDGTKRFCSGAGLVDRALLTAGEQMIDVDLRGREEQMVLDGSQWKTEAFRETRTASVTFCGLAVSGEDFVGECGWYVQRTGFWHGALGPAACWAGGAAGLLDAAKTSKREDAHTLAHLGAMQANVWGMAASLEVAGREIDEDPYERDAAQMRALTVRHLVEQACTDTLRRFARAYGPAPLAMEEEVSRRYLELDLFVRQSHAERDLEGLGRALKAGAPSASTNG